MAVWRGELSCLQGSRPQEATHTPVDNPGPLHLLAPLSGLCGFTKEKEHMKLGGESSNAGRV